MRILQIVPGFNYGGAENHVVDLANSLGEMGHEVFIVSSYGRQSERLNSNIKFFDYKISDLLLPLNFLWLCRFIKRNKIEVLHAHKRLAIFIGSLAGAAMRIPVIVTVHGQPKYDLRTVLTRRLPASIIFVSTRAINNNPVYDQVKHKAEFIQNGVNIVPNNASRKLDSLTYMSRIDGRHSGVILLIIKEVLPELLKGYPSIVFNVIGDGDGMALVIEAAEQLNKSAGHEVVKLHGFLSDVHPVIRSSGLVLGVGRASIEALANCVPVLSVNSKFMGEIITTANYRFYQLNNFVATGHSGPEGSKLTDMIKEYLNDPNTFQNDTRLLNANVMEDFGMQNIAGRILDLYKKFVSAKLKME